MESSEEESDDQRELESSDEFDEEESDDEMEEERQRLKNEISQSLSKLEDLSRRKEALKEEILRIIN